MHAVTVFAVLALATFTDAIAQEQQPLVPGQRLRITAPGVQPDHTIGTLVTIRGDTLVLSCDGSTGSVVFPSIERLETWRPRPGGKGALIGAGAGLLGGAAIGGMIELTVEGDQAIAPVVGAVAGTVMGALMGAGGRPVIVGGLAGLGLGGLAGAGIGLLADEEGNDLRSEDAAALGAGFFGIIGFFAGTIAGYITDRWEEVPLDRLRVSVAPRRDGRFGLALSVRF